MLPARPLGAQMPPEHPPNGSGRIAQLVEQLTLNQRVLGSSPSASTIRLSDSQPLEDRGLTDGFDLIDDQPVTACKATQNSLDRRFWG